MKQLLYFSTVLVIAGCAQLQGVPSAEPFPDASIKKAKSVQHWDVIASDVVAQTTIQTSKLKELQGKSLYVVQTDSSDFSRGFRSLLISRLVNSGVPVVTKSDGAAQVTYEAQVVRHLDGRGGFPNPGEIAALSGGVLVARQIAVSSASATAKVASGAALLAAADFAVSYAQLHSPTNSEVIITTSITDGDRYLLRKTDVYYVDDVEGTLFEPPVKSQTKIIEVIK